MRKSKASIINQYNKLTKKELIEKLLAFEKEKSRQKLTQREKHKNTILLLLDYMDAGIIVQDSKGEISIANKKACDIFSMTKKEVEGKYSIDHGWNMIDENEKPVKGEDHPSMITLRTGKPQKDIIRGLFADNFEKLKWILINTDPLKTKTNKVDKVIITFIDISKQYNAEKKLKQEISFNKTIIQTANSLVLGLDKNANIIFFNSFAERITGYTQDEVLNKNWFDVFIPGVDKKSIKRIYREVWEGKDLYWDQENIIRCKDGSELWLSWRNSRIKNEQGRVEYILSLGADITKTRKALEELKNRNQEIAQQNEEMEVMNEEMKQTNDQLEFLKFKSLIDNCAIGLYRTTPDGEILMANPVLCNLLGYEGFDELSKRNLEKDGFGPNYSRKEFKKNLERKGEIKGFESEWIKKDGTFLYVREYAHLVRDDDSRICYYEGAVEDITSLKVIEHELKLNTEKLEFVMFSTGIGLWDHDLTNNNVYRSDNWYKMLGYKPGELNNKLKIWQNLIHPEDKAKVEKIRIDHEEGRTELFQAEHRLKTRSGSWKWILNWGKIISRDKDGIPLRAVGVHIDIDDIRKKEKAYAEVESQLTLVLNSTNDLFVFYNNDLNIVQINKATTDFCNTTHEDSIGKKCYKIWRPEQNDYCDFCHVREALKFQKTIEKETKISGSIFRFKAVPVYNKEGHLVGVAEFGHDITKETIEKQEKEEKEANLNAVLESTEDAIWSVDKGGKILTVNSKFREEFKDTYGKELRRGSKILEMVPDVEAVKWGNAYKEAFKGRSIEFVESYKTRSGEQYFEIRVNPVIQNNTITGAAVITRNITGKIEAEQYHKQAQLIIKESPVILFKWKGSEGWPVEYVSENVKKILGYSAEDFISGKVDYMKIVHKKDVKKLEDEVIEFSLKEKKDHYIHKYYRLKTKKGKYIWVQDSTRVVRDSANKIKHYEGIIMDITEKILAEQKLKRSMERFYKIFEGSNQAMVILNNKGTITEINSAVSRITNLRRNHLEGKSAFILIKEFLKPKHVAIAVKTINALLKRELVEPFELEYNNRALRFHSFIKITDLGHVVVFDDITEIRKSEKKLSEYYKNIEKSVNERTKELDKKNKSLEESQKALTFLLEDVNESRNELQKAVSKVKDANKELESFSYSVSHDLKAPLRAIDGFSQILLEDYSDKIDEDGQRYLNMVRENTQKMGQLIQDLLDFSRAGRLKLNINKINLNSLIAEILAEIREPEKNRKMEISISDLPDIESDKVLIGQVFSNLISNAIKFTKQRKIARIKIKCTEKPEHYEFIIEDNGVGFNMKYAGKLFNVFQRLHTPDQFEGTGVGLAIVKRIIKRFNGKIWVNAEPEKGAKFYFILPKK